MSIDIEMKQTFYFREIAKGYFWIAVVHAKFMIKE